MLDPQLVCYSWVTGISEVAQVVFVRKRLVEIQYFHTTITDEQREEFGQLMTLEGFPILSVSAFTATVPKIAFASVGNVGRTIFSTFRGRWCANDPGGLRDCSSTPCNSHSRILSVRDA